MEVANPRKGTSHLSPFAIIPHLSPIASRANAVFANEGGIDPGCNNKT